MLLFYQFNRFEPEEGRISEVEFASNLLVYAGLNEGRRIKMIKRVKKAFKDEENWAKVCIFFLYFYQTP